MYKVEFMFTELIYQKKRKKKEVNVMFEQQTKTGEGAKKNIKAILFPLSYFYKIRLFLFSFSFHYFLVDKLSFLLFSYSRNIKSHIQLIFLCVKNDFGVASECCRDTTRNLIIYKKSGRTFGCVKAPNRLFCA